MITHNITLTGLPKFSTNMLYSGTHWTNRVKFKRKLNYIIKSQFKHVFSKDKQYTVGYKFYFKGTPLDASNCSGMLKMIEDIIFEDDKHDIIDIGGIQSRKCKNERVEIHIIEKEKYE